MSKIAILLFSSLFIINISVFDIPNIYSSYINPNIFNLSNPNDIRCYYEINIWYYIPSEINKIYFLIHSEEESTDVNFYLGKIKNNELLDMKLIEKNSENMYEILKEKDKLYVTFIKEQNENKKITIEYFYSENTNSDINSKILEISYYKNYPIELTSNPSPQTCLSLYDYENEPDKIYLISNNYFFIYYINSNSSSINYNTNNLQYYDQYDLNDNNKNEYKVYKNGNYYYLISKMIFIKIEKKDNFLFLEDISSANEKFI